MLNYEEFEVDCRKYEKNMSCIPEADRTGCGRYANAITKLRDKIIANVYKYYVDQVFSGIYIPDNNTGSAWIRNFVWYTKTKLGDLCQYLMDNGLDQFQQLIDSVRDVLCRESLQYQVKIYTNGEELPAPLFVLKYIW